MVRPASQRWRRQSVPPRPPFPGRSHERSGKSFEDERVRAGMRLPAAERPASRRDWRSCARSCRRTPSSPACRHTFVQSDSSIERGREESINEGKTYALPVRGWRARMAWAGAFKKTDRGPVLLSVGGNTDLSDHNIRIKCADQELCDQGVCGLHHPAWTPLAPDGTGECPGLRALSVTPAPRRFTLCGLSLSGPDCQTPKSCRRLHEQWIRPRAARRNVWRMRRVCNVASVGMSVIRRCGR